VGGASPSPAVKRAMVAGANDSDGAWAKRIASSRGQVAAAAQGPAQSCGAHPVFHQIKRQDHQQQAQQAGIKQGNVERTHPIPL